MATTARRAKAFVWEQLPPMPTKRVYCTPAACAGQLYVAGGCDASGAPLDCLEALAPDASQWTRLAPMPTARAGVGVAALGKQLLALGGVDGQQRPVAAVEAFCTEERRWERKAPLPEPIMGMAVIVKDCRVFVAGGMGADTTPLATLWEYEAVRDAWRALAPMPTPRYAATAFVRGGKIYVLGGRQGKNPVTAFEVYDVEAGTWARFPDLPTKRAFAGHALADRALYSLGGLEQPGLHNYYSRPTFVSTVETFDFTQGGWVRSTRARSMRERRADFVAGFLGGRVLAIGGLGNQTSPLASVEGLDPERGRWESLASMPTPRCSCSCVALDGRLLLVGGVSQGPSDAVEALGVLDDV
ncbi:kelch domain-containing protein 8B [Petromyzon marinus]|uniref:Kelch domain-containing protein 8B n=2 Tax=Petromyzon marinus TaxID=7757 RepID=A0AAJ7T2R9_PETMA|nr:kelch domain-containing protein 8B [Petromyzon marinus]XP_032810282.1 kelch domain-containing protein 8B [Petromyzon marinus]